MVARVWCLEKCAFLAGFVLKFLVTCGKEQMLIAHNPPVVTYVHALPCNVDIVCS